MDLIAERHETAESERLVLEMVDKFLATQVKPHVHALEHDDIYPSEIVEKMKEMGLFGCTIAPEYGGLGLSTSTYAKIIERMSSVWMSISGIVNSHLIMAMVVQRNGTDDQKAFLLGCNGCHTYERIVRSTHDADEFTHVAYRLANYARTRPGGCSGGLPDGGAEHDLESNVDGL